MTTNLLQETEAIASPNGRPCGGDSLELSGIVKRWQRKGAPVLDAVYLTVEPGTTTWIGGANGVGKTTLLRIATGAIMPDSGEVWFGAVGPEIDRREYHRQLAYLPAGDRNLYARLSVRRHLDLWGCLAAMDRGSRKAAISRVLEQFGLLELANRRCDRLSLGQRQRVRLAGTFLHEPSLVLLDEPHTSLDEEGLAMLAEACARIVARGGVMIWCSPPLERSKLPSDRQLVLEGGKLREQ